MASKLSSHFVVLAILDGWGIASENPGNAITQANTSNMRKFWVSYPHTLLEAAGEAVGLPRGEDGNTETGHLNLGAGRIVYQDLERINMAIADGGFFQNKVLLQAISHAKTNNSKLHYFGLIGAGGVHSDISHLLALIQLAAREKFTRLFLHLFTDGRDSPTTVAKTYVRQVKETIQKEGVGQIASIMGRYWAMDRDQRWDRTEKAYLCLTKGIGNSAKSAEEIIENSYSQGITDEFIEPSIILNENAKPKALVEKNDAIVFFNFRVDRPRQLTKAFIFEDFSQANIIFDFDPFEIKYLKKHIKKPERQQKEPFARGEKLSNLFFATMTEYGKPITAAGAKPAFPPATVDTPLGAVIAQNALRQLRITESEKERFVTYYFNGLKESPFTKEDRIIIPSPAVTTYDQKPEMSSEEMTKTLLSKIEKHFYDLIIVNYPNADMVGHTGNIGPTVKACEVVDECVGRLANHVLSFQGTLIITADHGNAEEMINLETGEIDTEHSGNKVPFIVVSHEFVGKPVNLRQGILADVAPTVLRLLGLKVPSLMTGRNLLGELGI